MIRRWVASERQIPRLYKAPTKKSKFGDSGLLLLAIPALTFCLGTWQVRRRGWKLGLIAKLEQRTTAEPIEIPDDWTELHAEEMQYRPVKVRGKFYNPGEIYVGPRTNVIKPDHNTGIMSINASGYNVITPFKLKDRDLIILVNRGWVPTIKKDPKTRPLGQVEDEIELVGLIRHTEKKSAFGLVNTPEYSGFWMLRDVEWMAKLAGTDPLFIDADIKSTHPEGPIGGQTRITLRNEHLSYIVTWYALSAITFWMWYNRYKRPPPPNKMTNFMIRRGK